MPAYTKEQSAFKPNVKVSNAKPKKPIKAKSAKRVDEENIYKKEHKKYLIAYPYCEVRECKLSSNQIHHKKGRIGSLLYNPEYFLAVCSDCHSKIELNPVWAKENGYSIDRL